jgi:hypothetical protein
VLLHQEVDGGVHEVINDGGHSEDTTKNTHNIDEERVPLVMRNDVKHSHRVGFVSA